MAAKSIALERVLEEIDYLKRYMHRLSLQVDSLTHPLLVEVSQMLDKKLNQHQRLTSQR
ncbi:MAG: aspartyl-phosphate phosphatase Spo0E family protein [Bacillaceae bacterium]|nr:aspartyl-phosphate phosphatase Spo0E family protein [Bacillaceae bacterium]